MILSTHRFCHVLGIAAMLSSSQANAFSASSVKNGFLATQGLPLAERAALLDLLPKSGFTCISPQENSVVCDACSALERASYLSSAIPVSSISNNIDAENWRLRFTSSDNPYGFLLAAAAGNNGDNEMSTTTLHFRTTFADDSLRVVRGAENGPLKNEVFVFERVGAGAENGPLKNEVFVFERVVRGAENGPLKNEVFVFERVGAGAVDNASTTAAGAATLADDDVAAYADVASEKLTPESFSDLPEECELEFEEDGTISILCDDAFVEDSATVSD
eukprot:CAMPEP_0178809602 /NCGR_PEP_ID=MMETSP0745-20121128/18201_1 /TAXON_ID=913974 /ORGANISM="Nitzschia punctata, Strain CCMP561" /LENGTH=275 /DNA_ID=CAMNT_0020469981 /DNA_START=78 /DNA_END=905 /DNA_ORIENTATION=+